MRITSTELPEVLIVEPRVHHDERGFFFESWQAERYAAHGLPAQFVQDNHSRSCHGVLRGLHLQVARPQGKLVRALAGEIFDVAVDVRAGSPRFGRHVGVRLSAGNFRQLWIPEGFAHGFCVISQEAEIQYKCTDFYDPASELTLAWDDPALAIPWPIGDPLVSAKDRAGRRLSDVPAEQLPSYPGAAHSAQ